MQYFLANYAVGLADSNKRNIYNADFHLLARSISLYVKMSWTMNGIVQMTHNG